MALTLCERVSVQRVSILTPLTVICTIERQHAA
jgi:hypothetical protein